MNLIHSAWHYHFTQNNVMCSHLSVVQPICLFVHYIQSIRTMHIQALQGISLSFV